MSIRDVLAQNFKKLKNANSALRTPAQLKERGVLSNGTLGRISKSQVNLGIDHLEPLAEAYGVQPWQLLNPDFDPVTDLDIHPKALKQAHQPPYSHVAQSIALLVDQIPESDASTRRRMLLAVSQISQEWSVREQSTIQEESDQKRPTKSRQVKT